MFVIEIHDHLLGTLGKFWRIYFLEGNPSRTIFGETVIHRSFKRCIIIKNHLAAAATLRMKSDFEYICVNACVQRCDSSLDTK